MVKNKRGAPKKHGVLDGWVLIRRLEAVLAYQKARMAGKTDRVSKEIAIAEVKRRIPGIKISKTEIERALAEFQPHDEMKENRPVFSSETDSNPMLGGVVKLKIIKYKSLRKLNTMRFSKKYK